MSTERFVKAMNAADIKPGQAKVVRVEDKQIAVFRLDEGKYCAIDNRCPHEGYPLVQGTVNDCVLTCDWHNWKFDLNDGKCTRGGEDVRSYPIHIDNGDLAVRIAQVGEYFTTGEPHRIVANTFAPAETRPVRQIELPIVPIAGQGAVFDGPFN